MLQAIRKSVTSWVGILVLAIALGALVFTLYQPTGPTGSGARGQVLATVAGDPIVESEFTRAIDRAVARERERTAGLTVPEFLGAGGGEMVLSQMIANKAILRFGERHGLRISRAMVDGEIASIPALQLGGEFNENLFRRLLAEQRLSEAEIREGIATDLLRRQLFAPVAAGTTMSASMAQPYASLLLEVREGFILPVPSAAMPDPGTPTLDQLRAYHAGNRQAYTIPERRVFRWAEIDQTAMRERARPTREEVRAYYDANPAEFGGVEQRDLSQVVLRDAARARALVAAVRGGTPFAAAAETEGFDELDIALGLQSREELARRVNRAVADTAFSLEPGQVSDPVQTPLGYHVLRVNRVVPPARQPFEQVANLIEDRLQRERVQDLMSETIASAEDRMERGESLADVARSLGLTLQRSPALTADGRFFDDSFMAERSDQPLLSRVFATEEADGPQVAELGQGRFALFEVTEVIAPALVPLEKIEDDVRRAWQVEQRMTAARREAERIAARLGEGQPLDRVLAGTLRLPDAQQLTIRRLELTQMAQQGQQVPPPVLLMLNMPVGQARVAPAPQAAGWFVVSVARSVPGDASSEPGLVDAVRQGLQNEAAGELVETMVRAIEREVGVVRQPEAVRAVNRRLTGAMVE